MHEGLPVPAAPVRPASLRSPALAAILGWLVPGLGTAYAGRPAKGVLFLLAIVATFGVGWWLTDLTGVDPVEHQLHLVGQALAAGPTAVAYQLQQGRVLTVLPRWMEVGRLYMTVAGLLNLVAVCDGVGEVIVRNRQILASRLAARRGAEREAAERAAAELAAQAHATAPTEATGRAWWPGATDDETPWPPPDAPIAPPSPPEATP